MSNTLKITIFLIIIIVVGLIFLVKRTGLTQQLYTQVEIRQDLKYLYSTLEASHYNLFAHTSKQEYDKEYNRLLNSLPDSLTLLDAYRVFQSFTALSQVGHCFVEFPFQRAYRDYALRGGELFPLNSTIIEDKIYIKENFSNNTNIPIGAEIISINGKTSQSILTMIYSQLSGERHYFKASLVDLISLPRVMWLIEKTPNVYDLKFKNKNGTKGELTVGAISAKEFENKYGQSQKSPFERELNFFNKVAYLKPGQFLNADNKINTSDEATFNSEEFKLFIDSSFNALQIKRTEELIIDLRNNPGGDNSFSDYMIAYFASEPFWFSSRFSVKTSQVTKDYWTTVNDTSLSDLKRSILAHKNGEIFDFPIKKYSPRPDTDKLKYKGNVYVLINRATWSNATATAAIIKDYKFGVIIGEETGDLPTNYGAIHQFKLPNTKMAVSYPKSFIIRPNGNTDKVGVVPDYFIRDNILSEKDETLEFTLEHINKQSNIKAGNTMLN